MDSETSLENRRNRCRFPVHLPTTFAGPGVCMQGMGIIRDLSLEGCRIDAPASLPPSLLVELRIYIPGQEYSVVIDGAKVQWVGAQTLGLNFLRIANEEQHHLKGFIERLSVLN